VEGLASVSAAVWVAAAVATVVAAIPAVVVLAVPVWRAVPLLVYSGRRFLLFIVELLTPAD